MKNIVVCASGSGSNFEAIIEACSQGRLAARVTGLIVNRAKVEVVGRANRLGIPHRVLNPKEFSSRKEWDHAMRTQLQTWQADWVVLAGFLALVGPEVLTAYAGHVVNSHPSLLPKHGGPGMYGDHVHQAVLTAKEIETGITIHLVDANYDQGRVVAQERVAVQPGDTVASLAARVKSAERSFYVQILSELIAGRLTIS